MNEKGTFLYLSPSKIFLLRLTSMFELKSLQSNVFNPDLYQVKGGFNILAAWKQMLMKDFLFQIIEAEKMAM